jgi:hypothetical protein
MEMFRTSPAYVPNRKTPAIFYFGLKLVQSRSRKIVEVCFYHCPREANEAADTLARRTEGSMSIVWQDDPPDFLILY